MNNYAVEVYGTGSRLENYLRLIADCARFSIDFNIGGLEVMSAKEDDRSDIAGRVMCADRRTAYTLAYYFRLQCGRGPINIFDLSPELPGPKLLKKIERPVTSSPS